MHCTEYSSYSLMNLIVFIAMKTVLATYITNIAMHICTFVYIQTVLFTGDTRHSARKCVY